MSAKNNDVLFHLLYGGDHILLMEVLGACVKRMYHVSDSDLLHSSWLDLVAREKYDTEKTRALLCLLLNIDMPLKVYVCDPKRPELWRAIFNIPEPKTEADRVAVRKLTNGMHSVSLMGCNPVFPRKAELFFKNLSRTVVPQWMQDECKGVSDLIHAVRMEYIHC